MAGLPDCGGKEVTENERQWLFRGILSSARSEGLVTKRASCASYLMPKTSKSRNTAVSPARSSGWIRA